MNRRGMVILAVLIAIVIAAVIAMGALSTAASGAEFSRASDRSAQLRSLAQSGVAAAAAELAAQRDQLLAGAAPKLTAEWELYKDQDVRGIVTILAHPQPADAPAGEPVLALSTAAHLDVNIADEPMLAAFLGPDDAARLVAQRARHPWTDRAECAAFLESSSSPAPDESAAFLPEPGSAPDAASPRQRLSASNFDPQVCPVDPKSPGAWTQSVNITPGITDAAAAQLTDLLGPDLFGRLRAAIGAQPPANREQLINAVRARSIAAADWSRLLDVLRFDDNPFVIGRVDLNRADAQTLACIPGITSETAAELVRTRERLDAARRSQLAWPVLEQVLTPEAFARAADWLTTRSMVWEIRVQAAITRDEPKSTLALATWIVTIDVADPTPRLVSIHDEGFERSLALASAAIPADAAPSEPPPESPPNKPQLDSDPGIKDDDQSGVGLAMPPDSGPSEPPVFEPVAPPAAPKDNRLGRWTTGGGR